jgi:hypothetical protein
MFWNQMHRRLKICHQCQRWGFRVYMAGSDRHGSERESRPGQKDSQWLLRWNSNPTMCSWIYSTFHKFSKFSLNGNGRYHTTAGNPEGREGAFCLDQEHHILNHVFQSCFYRFMNLFLEIFCQRIWFSWGGQCPIGHSPIRCLWPVLMTCDNIWVKECLKGLI